MSRFSKVRFRFLSQRTQLHILLHILLAFIVVGHDVTLHIMVGQALEGGLGRLANNPLNLIIGIRLAGLLKVEVLLRAKLTSLVVVLLGQLDGVLLIVDGDVRHSDYLFLSALHRAVVFVPEGFVPFVVITLYDTHTLNMSFYHDL